MKLGLIGYPIKYSLSPWIHEQFLQASGIEGEYELFEIKPDTSLKKVIKDMKKSGVKGVNVTVPYKQQIIPYLDGLDPVASSIGAVNTIMVANGKMIGYNTDGVGYIKGLNDMYPDFLSRQTKCLIIGAGGAARSIYVTLSKYGIKHMDIVNRTQESAEDIALLGEKHTATNVLSWREAENKAGYYDILIQTTSIGMKPKINEMIMSLDNVKEGSVVSDIIYQPIHTTFLEHAKRNNALILPGHVMLLYQAKEAFEIWTNQKRNVTHLIEPLQHILEGR